MSTETQPTKSWSEVSRLLTASEVLSVTGYKSRTTLWRKVRARAFPAPVKLTGSALRWRAEEIEAWIDEAPRQDYGRDA